MFNNITANPKCSNCKYYLQPIYNNITPNPKCSKCKCYWKPTDDDIRPSGLHFKTCVKCRTVNKPRNIYLDENGTYTYIKPI